MVIYKISNKAKYAPLFCLMCSLEDGDEILETWEVEVVNGDEQSLLQAIEEA